MMNTIFRNLHILTIIFIGHTVFVSSGEVPSAQDNLKNELDSPKIKQKEFFIIGNIEKTFEHIRWEDVLHKDGIKVQRKKLDKESIFALKASGVLEASIESIITIFRDTKKAHHWAPGLKQRTLLKDISELEAVVYDIHEMPWPCQDRDIVMFNSIKLLTSRKQIALISSSMENFKLDPKPTDKVRAELHYSFIGLTPISKDKTLLEFFIHVDPRGSLPKWLVNHIVKTKPYSFLKAIEKSAKNTPANLGKNALKLVDRLKTILSKKKLSSNNL